MNWRSHGGCGFNLSIVCFALTLALKTHSKIGLSNGGSSEESLAIGFLNLNFPWPSNFKTILINLEREGHRCCAYRRTSSTTGVRK